MSIRQFRPDDGRHALPLGLGFRRDHARRRRRSRCSSRKKQSGGRNNTGHVTSRHKGGGHKQHVPGHRLQAEQVRCRRARSRRSSTIRTARARIALLRVRRRREALHPAPEGPEVGRHRGERAGLRHPDRATRCRWPRCRWAPRCTTSSSSSARAGRWRALPAPASRWWPRRASTSRCGSGRREMRMVHGRCLATIGEVGNAEHELISIGKAGANRWRAGARRCAAWPRTRWTIRWAVVRARARAAARRCRRGASRGQEDPASGRRRRTKLIVRGRKRGKATK